MEDESFKRRAFKREISWWKLESGAGGAYSIVAVYTRGAHSGGGGVEEERDEEKERVGKGWKRRDGFLGFKEWKKGFVLLLLWRRIEEEQGVMAVVVVVAAID